MTKKPWRRSRPTYALIPFPSWRAGKRVTVGRAPMILFVPGETCRKLIKFLSLDTFLNVLKSHFYSTISLTLYETSPFFPEYSPSRTLSGFLNSNRNDTSRAVLAIYLLRNIWCASLRRATVGTGIRTRLLLQECSCCKTAFVLL